MKKSYPEEVIEVPRFNEANGFYTTRERSALMGKILASNTKPEQKLRKVLHGLGLRYRKNWKKLPGTPDIVFSRYRLAIFIDGEFWHGRNWEDKKEKIKSNRGFWIPKIERNMQRDRFNNALLEEKGWHVMRFWDSEIKNDFGSCLQTVLDYIDNFQFSQL